MRHLFSLFCMLIIAATGLAQNLPEPTGLSVALLRSPEAAVITDATPELAWVFPQSGGQQSAYRILVATSPFLLKEGRADRWDSGRVESQQSVNVSYAGSPLKDNSVYWWQVRLWSKDKLESPYSVPQQFNTGDYDRTDLAYPGESRCIEPATGQQ